MSALEVTDEILKRIHAGTFDLVIVNYANGDMVGHTGNLEAAIHAVETVDACVGRVVEATLEQGGSLIVTADHGNCEQMIDPESDGPHTAHTTNPVPLVLCADDLVGAAMRPMGVLADVVPTLCELCDIPKSEGMDGSSLLA